MVTVSAVNGYFADAAPWALRQTDPARMATVLAQTVDAVRRIAILSRPFMPAAMTALLNQLGVDVDRRSFAALDTTVRPGTPLPAPEGVFPRWTADAA